MFLFLSFWQLVFKKIFFLSQGILFNKVYRFHGKVNMGKVAASDKTSVCKRESFLLQNLKPVKPVVTTQSGPLDLSCKGCYVMCSSQLCIPRNNIVFLLLSANVLLLFKHSGQMTKEPSGLATQVDQHRRDLDQCLLYL